MRNQHKVIDLRGHRYGNLTVLERRRDVGESMWLCRCDCGTEKPISSANFRNSRCISSCGCLKDRLFRARVTKHGDARSGARVAEYTTWVAMIDRCENPKNKKFSCYGGRGIKVCDRWRQSYPDFLSDMGRKRPGDSIERINFDGNYEPENCKWIPMANQAKNRRTTNFLTLDGVTLCVADWCRKYDISLQTFQSRLKAGMNPLTALETAPKYCGTRSRLGASA